MHDKKLFHAYQYTFYGYMSVDATNSSTRPNTIFLAKRYYKYDNIPVKRCSAYHWDISAPTRFLLGAIFYKKQAMEDSVRRSAPNKWLLVNQRVSGSLGDWIQGPTKRHRRQRLFGTIVGAVGERKYLVRFDDGSEKECSSATLRVEKSHASLPPDIPLQSNEVEH